MHQGWFKLWRKAMKSKVFANAEIWKLWTLCIAKANWGDEVLIWEGSTTPIEIKRGQFVTGRESLHLEYYAVTTGNRKTSRTVWRWLHILESWHCLRLENVQKYTLVTLLNYRPYQDQTGEDVQVLVQPDVQVVSRSCPDDVQVVSTSKKGLESTKKNQEPEEAKEKGDTIQDVADVWAKTPGTVPIRKMTNTRKRAGAARLKDKDWDWRAALAKFPLPCFGDGEWTPEFDWLLRPGTVNAILEGKYDWSKDNGKPTDPDRNIKGASDWLQQKIDSGDLTYE